MVRSVHVPWRLCVPRSGSCFWHSGGAVHDNFVGNVHPPSASIPLAVVGRIDTVREARREEMILRGVWTLGIHRFPFVPRNQGLADPEGGIFSGNL